MVRLDPKGGGCQRWPVYSWKPYDKLSLVIYFRSQARQADLTLPCADAYYGSLTAYGVRSVESLMQLTMQDYGVVGVHSMEDRKSNFIFILSFLLTCFPPIST